jgi:hypothetical protein
MATRTAKMIQHVLEELGDDGTRIITRNRVLDALNEAQKELCRDGYALKRETTLDLVALQEEYDVAGTIHKIVEFIEPEESTWKYPVTVLNNTEEWKNVRRRTDLSDEQPLFAFLWNRVIHLWPVPPEVETVGLIVYGMPAADLTVTTEPEIEDQWDIAMEYGALKRLAKGDDKLKWMEIFEKVKNKIAADNVQESIAGTVVRSHWSSSLNY